MTDAKLRGVSHEKFRVAIDAKGCCTRSLESVNNFLIEIASTIKVKIRSLTLLEVDNLKAGEMSGILASVLYLESSMTLHVSPEHKEVSLDLFLYREADVMPVVNAFRHFYKPEVIEVNVWRGLKIEQGSGAG